MTESSCCRTIRTEANSSSVLAPKKSHEQNVIEPASIFINAGTTNLISCDVLSMGSSKREGSGISS